MLEPEELVGHKIDRYEINQYLATGSMAYVYRGRDIALDRDVAIKVLHPKLLVDETFVTRFRREAKVIARLRHPNIVQIYTTGITAEALHYIAMEYVQGGTLADTLANSALPAFDVVQALLLIRRVAEALSVAHQAGVVHRDVKPSNILLRPEGTPVLADLGLALALNESRARLTLTGALVGTPNYISPEQVSGRDLDGRSDIYSLGIILYELLAGQPPFAGESPLAIIEGHLRREPEPLEDIRPGLAPQTYQIVYRCIRKTAEARYESAEELVAALNQAILAENRRAAQPASSEQKPPPATDVTQLLSFEEDMADGDPNKTQLWSYDPGTADAEEKPAPKEKVEADPPDPNQTQQWSFTPEPAESVKADPPDPDRTQVWSFTSEPAESATADPPDPDRTQEWSFTPEPAESATADPPDPNRTQVWPFTPEAAESAEASPPDADRTQVWSLTPEPAETVKADPPDQRRTQVWRFDTVELPSPAEQEARPLAPEAGSRPARRRWWLYGAAVVIVLIILAVLFFLASQDGALSLPFAGFAGVALHLPPDLRQRPGRPRRQHGL